MSEGFLPVGHKKKDPEAKSLQSVILAGVTDVKHLKSKIREDEQHKVNSPWNIATDFKVDMSLSQDGIRGMLKEYESDHHTGMASTRPSEYSLRKRIRFSNL